MTTTPSRIGFIGLGIMGQSMAGHLLAAGHPLSVYNRSADKATALAARGAVICSSPAQVAQQSDIIITMVGYPRDVEQVWCGPDGLIAHARNALLIDMTTSSPALAKRLAQEAAQAGHQALDAPVSGGDVGAREAKLSIMVGENARLLTRPCRCCNAWAPTSFTWAMPGRANTPK